MSPMLSRRHKQRRTAGYADDGHPESLLIAKKVAGGYLMGEFHPPPDGRDLFQQNAPSRLGGTGLEQGSRALSQRSAAGRPGSQQGAGNHRKRCDQRVAGNEQKLQRRQLVHHVVGHPDHRREESDADRQPDC